MEKVNIMVDDEIYLYGIPEITSDKVIKDMEERDGINPDIIRKEECQDPDL